MQERDLILFGGYLVTKGKGAVRPQNQGFWRAWGLRSITINFCQGLDIISQERDLILFGVSPLTENTCILRRSSSHI